MAVANVRSFHLFWGSLSVRAPERDLVSSASRIPARGLVMFSVSLKSARFNGSPVPGPSLQPRPPGRPSCRVGPRASAPRGPRHRQAARTPAYLLLGPAELLLHLLGEEAGSAARLALSHPAGSPGARPGPAPCGFCRPPRRKCGPGLPRIRRRPAGLALRAPRCPSRGRPRPTPRPPGPRTATTLSPPRGPFLGPRRAQPRGAAPSCREGHEGLGGLQLPPGPVQGRPKQGSVLRRRPLKAKALQT